ncbi:Dna2/Cas4 domain-containing protein [Thermogymnomonas acidicola]|uniref:Dna2/Cas4 domain-containing protein n=1 Tax=Thermogymnomonas acidicola TaxID=399579 RepID=UPI00166F1114|nr:Dna2/Cas4 domain-containing protein [Thermogymnomonas acidicola]
MGVERLRPEEIRGTDVSYSQICDRRLWLSVHNIYITDGTEFVMEGKYLAENREHPGFSRVKVGSNVIDNLEILPDGTALVHEYKRGRKALKADVLQLAHYLNCLLSGYGVEARGILHLTGSRKVVEIALPEHLQELQEAYRKIESMTVSEIPQAKRNWFCRRGCSYVEFCWGGR